MPPKSSKSELHKLSRYPDKGRPAAAEDAQSHPRVLRPSSEKGSGEEMLASSMQISVTV